jgi:hypothetical protein
MGDKASLIRFFQAFLTLGKSFPLEGLGDQTFAQLAQVKYPALNIQVDSTASIWFSFQNYQSGDLKGDVVQGTECTASYFQNELPPQISAHSHIPIFVHFNGNGHVLQPSCTRRILTALNVQSDAYLVNHDTQQQILLSSIAE